MNEQLTALLEKLERYEKALRDITNTASMDGYVLKNIAKKALTPKTGSDEKEGH